MTWTAAARYFISFRMAAAALNVDRRCSLVYGFWCLGCWCKDKFTELQPELGWFIGSFWNLISDYKL